MKWWYQKTSVLYMLEHCLADRWPWPSWCMSGNMCCETANHNTRLYQPWHRNQWISNWCSAILTCHGHTKWLTTCHKADSLWTCLRCGEMFNGLMTYCTFPGESSKYSVLGKDMDNIIVASFYHAMLCGDAIVCHLACLSVRQSAVLNVQVPFSHRL